MSGIRSATARRLRYLVAAGAAYVLAGGALPALAAAPASIEAGGPTQQATTVGSPFQSELLVFVTDVDGNPVVGETVVFTVPASGASAALPPAQVQTDEDGQASVAATANGTVGQYVVTAAVGGLAPIPFTLWNIPVGFRPGQQLASVTARDEKGKTRNIRDFLKNGREYALIEVCASFCAPCRFTQQQALIAFARLADRKIRVNLGAMLMEGSSGVPSTQGDAQLWKSDLGLPDPVLHSEGSTTSSLYRAAGFILGIPDPGFPTSLLVAPDGTIIDRVVGLQDADEIEARILRAVLAERPALEAISADVRVVVGRRSLRGTAAPSLTGRLGTATFESNLEGLVGEAVQLRFEGSAPLPDEVRVHVSPTWTDGYRRTNAADTVSPLFMSRLGGAPFDLANFVDVASPLNGRGGNASVVIDVAAFRAALATFLLQFVGEDPDNQITQEQADGIVRDVYGVEFSYFVNVDVRLRRK